MLRPSLWQARRASLRTLAPFHGCAFLHGGITACVPLWAIAAWHALVSQAHSPLTQASLVLGLIKLVDPPSVRPTGRWSVMYGPLFDSFGPVEPAAAFIVLV
jgi:hypothetical protein